MLFVLSCLDASQQIFSCMVGASFREDPHEYVVSHVARRSFDNYSLIIWTAFESEIRAVSHRR
jgi:hypothetical protein